MREISNSSLHAPKDKKFVNMFTLTNIKQFIVTDYKNSP